MAPENIKQLIPLSAQAGTAVEQSREQLKAILDRNDPRLLFIVGPCLVHDVDAEAGYARRLKGLADDVKETIIIAMRVYFAKPRTTTDWCLF